MKRRDFLTRIFASLAIFSLGWSMLRVRPAASISSKFPKPGKKDRCPVCGMFVYRYPKWMAGFVFGDGKRYFHCCPKCMLHNLNNISKYQRGESREKLALIWVTEYYTTKKMDAHDVLFVVGTNLVGPMGLDLIPVNKMKAANNLKQDYEGDLVLRLDQITPKIIERARKGRLKSSKK
jgi:nitrous oxide reductase accessory protein NosL